MISSTAGEKKGKTTGKCGQTVSDGSAELTFSVFLRVIGLERIFSKKNMLDFPSQNGIFFTIRADRFLSISRGHGPERSAAFTQSSLQVIYEKTLAVLAWICQNVFNIFFKEQSHNGSVHE